MHLKKGRSGQWERPSERTQALLRLGAELALRAPPEWLEELDQATLGTGSLRGIADDPVLAAAIRRTNRSNLVHWAAANVRDPGAPVAANLGAEPLGIARDLVRRGLDESTLHAYRTGQNAAWLRWMEIAFQLTSDPHELHELLEVSARSIMSFIDATIEGISARMKAERDELTRGTHAERREVVALLLEGAPIGVQNASQRLGYRLDQTHQAAVVWSDRGETDQGSLERAVDALALAAGGGRPLTVVASAATRWVWLPVSAPVDPVRVQVPPDVRVALSAVGGGVEGFRRGHLDALTTQRMVARLGSGQRVVSFERVQLVSLVTHDAEGAERFVHDTLGELAPASVELRDTLRTFLDEGSNASAAAARLRTHRNTLLRRLARAEELLPRPLAHNRVHVAVALEVQRWQSRGP